jgi:hypothetical protein
MVSDREPAARVLALASVPVTRQLHDPMDWMNLRRRDNQPEKQESLLIRFFSQSSPICSITHGDVLQTDSQLAEH